MQTEVKLPALGEGDDAPTSAKVSFWCVDPGETVAEGDDIVQMLTDKATFDVPSPAAGKVVEVRGAEDESINVGDVIAIIETEG